MKYKNIKVSLDGYSFSSKLEASVFTMIKMREVNGELKLLQVQDHIYLTKARILYIPDFKCLDIKTNKEIWIEAKGMQAPTWPIKKKLWKFYGPGVLEVWRGSHLRPFLDETIVPESEDEEEKA